MFSIASESAIRLIFFLGILVLMVLWEVARPKREGTARTKRWPSNFGIIVLNAIVLIGVPITAVEASLFSTFNQFGLLIWLELPLWPSMIISLIVLDLAIYWQHRIFHGMPLFWRVHRMHHSDIAIDVSTGLRFHPVEIVLSILIKAAVIVLLGAPLLSVIAFEIILNGCAMFNHSNIRLAPMTDRFLRYFIVTPDMHRVHHSNKPSEHHQNFGFCLSIWDRIFSSYCPQPSKGHHDMTIGLDYFNAPEESRLDKLLTQPFRN